MVKRAINDPVSLRLPQGIATELQEHLFPGDGDEHGAESAPRSSRHAGDADCSDADCSWQKTASITYPAITATACLQPTSSENALWPAPVKD